MALKLIEHLTLEKLIQRVHQMIKNRLCQYCKTVRQIKIVRYVQKNFFLIKDQKVAINYRN